MNNDYVELEYCTDRRPLSSYPRKLAFELCSRWNLEPGSTLLDIASGRAEVARGFVDWGLDVTCLDAAPSAAIWAEVAGAHFQLHEIRPAEWLPFASASFDVVYSKSFVEHLREPIPFLEDVARVLRPGGLALMLTPDWETNQRIFFDDVTHVTPFTTHTIRQAMQLAGLECVAAYRFRQLPFTWRSPVSNAISACVAPFVPPRTRAKFLRWSRELMVCGVGRRPD